MTQFGLFDDTANDVLRASTYGEFKARLAGSNCRKCALCEGRTNIVVDRGTPETEVMVVGEGPGENEDLQGKAFVGRAGKLFDTIMASIGIDSDAQLLIANVVKCRPPENRAPKKEEAEACLPYLRRQIELVKPRVVVLLGATALKHMDPAKKDFAMKEEAGKFFTLPDYPDVRFMVLYHPAALLYDAKLKPAMWEHVKSLRKFLDARNGGPS